MALGDVNYSLEDSVIEAQLLLTSRASADFRLPRLSEQERDHAKKYLDHLVANGFLRELSPRDYVLTIDGRELARELAEFYYSKSMDKAIELLMKKQASP